MDNEDRDRKDNIKDWLTDEVTIEFFEYVKKLRDECDMRVHQNLEVNATNQASLENAGMTQLEEVLRLPEFMMDNPLEEKEDS